MMAKCKPNLSSSFHTTTKLSKLPTNLISSSQIISSSSSPLFSNFVQTKFNQTATFCYSTSQSTFFNKTLKKRTSLNHYSTKKKEEQISEEISEDKIQEYIDQRISHFRDFQKATFNDDNEKDLRKIMYPPHSFSPNISIPEFIEKFSHLKDGEELLDLSFNMTGRVMLKRDQSKKLIFLEIEGKDGKLQIIANEKLYSSSSLPSFSLTQSSPLPYSQIQTLIKKGDIIGVKGFPKRTIRGELSIVASEFYLLSTCLQFIPSSFGLKDIETRYRKRYLDLMIHKNVRERFQLRSKIIKMIRNSLEEEGYLEVETPILWSQAGGANATPFITHFKDQNANLYLRIAPELFLKELIVGGMDKVFEIGKQFRNEGIDTTHNPEFTSCEFYHAYGDYNTMINFVETLIHRMAVEIFGTSKIELENGKIADFSLPFKRIDILSSLKEQLHSRLGITDLPDPNSHQSAEEWEEICRSLGVYCSEPKTTPRLIDKLIGHLIEDDCISPTFLLHHPLSMSPLSKTHRENEQITERFELFVGGFEVVNAYSELNDPDEQAARFHQQSLEREKGDAEAQETNTHFLGALQHGLPPTAGCGIGIDRLVMIFSRCAQIKEVLFFPLLGNKGNS